AIFTSDPGVQYSDMNAFGHAAYGYFIFKLYWGAFCLMLAALSTLLWQRGSEPALKIRLAHARNKANRPVWLVAAGGLLAFIVCGGFIYYNTNIENKHYSDFQQEEIRATYEKKFKKFEQIP